MLRCTHTFVLARLNSLPIMRLGAATWIWAPRFQDLLATSGELITLLLVVWYCVRVQRCHRRSPTSVVLKVVELSLVTGSVLPLWKCIQGPRHFELHSIARMVSQTISWIASFVALRCFKGGILKREGRALCGFWVLKPIFYAPVLWTAIEEKQASKNIEELCTLFTATVVSVLGASFLLVRRGALEEHLLDSDTEVTNAPPAFWSKLTFGWVNPLMDAGNRKQLAQEDLFPLPSDLAAEECFCRLWERWIKQEIHRRSLFWTIFFTYGWIFLAIGLLKVVNDALSFSGPILLNAIVKSLQADSSGAGASGYWYACGLGAVSILRGFMGTHYTFLVSRLRLKLRAGIITLVYRKALNVSLAERNTFSTGEIQTMMSVDAERTINLFSSMHDLWSLPLQMAIALWMLYMQVSFSFLAGLAVIVVLIPVNRWIAVKISSANKFMMLEKDARVQCMSEMLCHMNTVKMYAWENIFTQRVKKAREKEVKYLATRKYLDALCVYFWACTPILFSVLTFGVFTVLGHTLDAATVFTSLALFNILISPLNSFPWVITGIVEAYVSIQRLQKFLVCPEPVASWNDASDIDSKTALKFNNANFAWSVNGSLTLKDISLDVPKGSLVVIAGQVGAGKTSMLYAMLNEMNCTRGAAYVQGSVAFVSQTPWIRSETLRDNILFGRPYIPERYTEVLRGCALDVDVAQMHKSDLSEIGERGYNLSGGQKARLSLARAIYQDCDVYLLDDPLSAVDAHVAAWLMQHAIQGPLLGNKTRILCTHHVQAFTLADMLIFMEEGCIKHVSRNQNSQPRIVDVRYAGETPEITSNCDKVSYIEQTPLVEEETRLEGRVKGAVYRTYAAFTGLCILAIIFTSTFLMQASKNGSDWWLAHWVDSTLKNDDVPSVKFFLRILILIGCLNSLFTFVRAFSFAYGGLRAALEAHDALLKNILCAPVSFFEKNPVGRILNRFSSDLYTIDDSLPFIANILLAHIFNLLGILILFCFVQWEVLAFLVPLSFIYYRVQGYYRKTSRELRRLDSVSRSPIYASFCEALDGASTIRAFKCQDMFATKNASCVEANQRASYSEIAASLWLSIRLQMMASFLVFFVSIMAIVNHRQGRASAAGLSGLALSYAAPVISLLNDLLTAFTETEKEMISVERVQQYLNMDSEIRDKKALFKPDERWPERGEITFSRVKLYYRLELPPALDGITFKISGGEKIGIAGRTGAGKSSILAALFRLKPISSGSITLDGVDINSVGLHKLRSCLAVVPQNPFLFEGTIRDNLDPTGVARDDVLWEVISKCYLKAALVSTGGLDTHVRECGESLSLGQRQLLCLARSLLTKSRVLCLDECTANVDPETTMLLKKTIVRECRSMTVVTIAHRIATIHDTDRVLILEQGKVVEEGDPRKLSSHPESRFCRLIRASGLD